MNRVIKFRAWDLNDEEMRSWDNLITTRYNQDFLIDWKKTAR